MSSGEPVFVVGMPRSGTTLMRSILNAHPSIAIAPETHIVNHWMQVHRRTSLAEPTEFDRFWKEYTAAKPFRWLGFDADETKARIHAAGEPTFRSIFATLIDLFAEHEGKARSGEKTPANYQHLELLFDWYPRARVIYMLRDPRAVIASFKAKGADWSDRPIEEIAFRWRRAAQRAERWAADPRVLLMLYADLVNHPEREVRRACEHLGEPFDARMLDSRSRNPDRVVKADSTVSTASLEKWRDQLSDPEVAVIEHLTRGPFERLGLAQGAPALPFSTRLRLDAKAAVWRIRSALRGRSR